jgi:hypothetical protein
MSGQLHAPAALAPGERSRGTHWIGGWVDPRADMDDVEKRKFLILTGLELRPLGRPVRSWSVHRLCYSGSMWNGTVKKAYHPRKLVAAEEQH